MKENSIEEDMRILERIDVKYFMSAKIEQSDYMIDKADEVNNAIEHILSDYKRVLEINEILLKENEELKDRIREHTMLISPYYVKENYIPVEKVKDKIEELKINLVNMQGEELLIYESKIDVLQELLEGRK